MEEADLALLNEIAVWGSNHAETQHAQIIIEALKLAEGDSERVVCSQGLNDFNRGRFPEAVKLLGPWCDNNPPGTTHCMLAMTLWQWGRKAEAERYCRDVIESSESKEAIAFAKEILDNLK